MSKFEPSDPPSSAGSAWRYKPARSAAHHLDQQLFPFPDRRSAPLEVRPSELATMIEELRMSVLERCDLVLDERVDPRQQGCDVVLCRHSPGRYRLHAARSLTCDPAGNG